MGNICQIRMGYRAQWKDIAFSVEGESSQWTLRVHDSNSNRTLYIGQRSNRKAAQLAAVEFAVLRDGRMNPEALASQLNWLACWEQGPDAGDQGWGSGAGSRGSGDGGSLRSAASGFPTTGRTSRFLAFGPFHINH